MPKRKAVHDEVRGFSPPQFSDVGSRAQMAEHRGRKFGNNPAPLAPLIQSDLLAPILVFCDKPTLAACLRVSKYLFAGVAPLLYRHLTFDHRTPHSFAGVSGGPTNSRKRKTQLSVDIDGEYSKRSLLRHLRTLDIHTHSDLCQFLNASEWETPALETVRIFAEPGDFELCADDPCGLLEALKYRTLIIDGLSGPCAETPFGLDLAVFPDKLEKIVLRFVKTDEVYRASLDYRLYRTFPPTLSHVVLHYPASPEAPESKIFENGAGRLILDDFEPEEGDDDFGQAVTLPLLADLFAEMVVHAPGRTYTFLDPGRFDPAWAGVPGASEEEVAGLVSEAMRKAVEAKLKRRNRRKEEVEECLGRLRFIGLRDYLAVEAMSGEYLSRDQAG